MSDSWDILREALGEDVGQGVPMPDGTVAWSASQCVEVVKALRSTKVAVHGGEFFHSEPIGLVPTYEGWNCTRAYGESATDFAVRSREMVIALATSDEHAAQHIVLRLGDQENAA